MPRTVTATEAKNRFGSIVEWVREHNDEVIVQSRGEPSAVIISASEYEKLKSLREEARRREALERLRRIRKESLARNLDLTPEEGEALADRFAHEFFEDLAREGKIRFQQ